MGLAAHMLELTLGNACRLQTPKKVRHAHEWAVLPRGGADEDYKWLLDSGDGSAEFWLDALGIDRDYWRELVYQQVEQARRKEALRRCRLMGRIAEALCLSAR